MDERDEMLVEWGRAIGMDGGGARGSCGGW